MLQYAGHTQKPEDILPHRHLNRIFALIMNEIIIYDLEFTTWQGALARNWSGKDEIREIVWIAAIRVDAHTLEEIDSFACIVRPALRPVLSEYFVALTGLTQQRVNKEGKSFLEGFHAFQRFVGPRPTVCHGADAMVLLENFQLKGMNYRSKRMEDNVPIILDLNKTGKGPDLDLETTPQPKSLVIDVYSDDYRTAAEADYGVVYEIDPEHGDQSPSPVIITSFNIRPWFNKIAPETIGKYSGELAAALEQKETDDHIHDPLFDVRSILRGANHLITRCGADNFFEEILNSRK